MASADIHALIDKVYEAALDPEQWSEFSQLLQEAFASPMAGLFVQNKWSGDFRRATLIGIPSESERSYNDHYASVNPWFLAGLIRPDLTIVETSLDEHLNRPGAYYETEFYNDRVAPMGFKHSMGGAVKTIGSDAVTFTVFRGAEAGPFRPSELRLYEALRPHIGRAVDIGGRLEDLEWQARAHEQLQDRLPLGVILLDDEARILEVNAWAEQSLAAQDPLCVRGNRLAATSPRENEDLGTLINGVLGLRDGRALPEPGVAVLTRRDGVAALSIAAVPLSGERPVFAERAASAILFLSSSEQPAPLRRDRLESCYGLTRAEAWLTSELARFGDLKQAANAVGVAHETARGYLKSILRKTGTHGQTELLGRLLSDWSLLVMDA